MTEQPSTPRITAEVNLGGAPVEEGAGRLNPILQRIADRTRSAAAGEGEGQLMFSRLQYSRSAGS